MLPWSLLDNCELVDLELIQQLVEPQRIYAWLQPACLGLNHKRPLLCGEIIVQA